MNITRKRAVIMIAVILVLTASCSMGYIYNSSPNVSGGEGGKKDNLEGRFDDWIYQLPEGASFDWLFNIILGLIIGLLIGSILGIMMVSRNDLLAFMASIASISFLFLISLYIEFNPHDGGYSFFFFTEWFESNMLTIEPSSTLKAGIIIFLLLTIAASFISKVSPFKVKRMDVSDREGRGKETVKGDITDQVSETVDRAVKSLLEGGGTRGVIIRCYQRMCRIIERDGVSSDDSMTPREFQEKVIERLCVSRDTMDQLTRIFEEARYSDHLLEKKDEQDARRALKKLKNELRVMD